MRRRQLSGLLLALLLALVPALAVAGCGDDDGDKKPSTTATTATPTVYKTQVQQVLASVGTAGTELGASARASNSPQSLADALAAFQSKVNTAADRLAALRPPPAAQQGQDDLEQTLREIASGVQSSIEAARAGDRSTLQARFRVYQAKLNGEFRRRLTSAGRAIDRALADS